MKTVGKRKPSGIHPPRVDRHLYHPESCCRHDPRCIEAGIGILGEGRRESGEVSEEEDRFRPPLSADEILVSLQDQGAEGRSRLPRLSWERATSLRFVSAFSLKAKRQEGLVFVIYKVEEGKSSGKVLKVYEKRVLNKDVLGGDADEEQFLTLMDGLSDFKFEYFDEGEDQGRDGRVGRIVGREGEEGAAQSGEDDGQMEREERGAGDCPSHAGFAAGPSLRRSGRNGWSTPARPTSSTAPR